MLNQILLVGRLTKKPYKKDNTTIIEVAIPRSFKNEKGEYDTDIVECKTFSNVADNVMEYCNKGDIIGIKGRIQTKEIEKYHSKMTIVEIIAEKVTFLSSK